MFERIKTFRHETGQSEGNIDRAACCMSALNSSKNDKSSCWKTDLTSTTIRT